jgi:hypothetical protein
LKSCISEAQKYQDARYRPGKEKKSKQNNSRHITPDKDADDEYNNNLVEYVHERPRGTRRYDEDSDSTVRERPRGTRRYDEDSVEYVRERPRGTRRYDEDSVEYIRDRPGGTRRYDEDSVGYFRDQRDNRHWSPRPEFRRAKGFHGNAITIDVPLQNTGGLMGFLSTKQIPRQTTAKWLEIDGQLERRYHCEKIERIDVLSSHKYSTDGEESAVLHYKKSSRGSSDGQFRWMYGSILSVDFLPLLTMSAVICKARLAAYEISRQVSKGFPVESAG